jgi:hypothetical protein
MTWRIPALASVLVASTALCGCLAHERPEDSVDAGHTILVDTSIEALDVAVAPRPDASVVIDATLALDGAAPSCTPDTRSVGVRVVPVTTDTARCAVHHAEGVSLLAIDAAPADDGITLHFDLCPGADADCRCDVVVTSVGADIASTLAPTTNLTLELSAGEGFSPGAVVSITKVPTCECHGCGCSEPLYLFAATLPPDGLVVPMPMTFSQGAAVCPMSDCTFGGSWRLHARGDAGEADVPGGTDRDLGSVHVRSVRDVEVFQPCAACAECDTPIAAWVAWVSSR